MTATRNKDPRGWEYDEDANGSRCYYPTPEQWASQRDEACAEIGMTWAEMSASLADCGCCFDLPDDLGWRVKDIWFMYATDDES